MKFLSAVALVLSLGLAVGVSDAEAKRIGGGKSTGMQRQGTTEKAPTATPAQTPGTPAAAAAPAGAAAGATAAAAAPKRSWMGPLAGIAAGLGLAALASHLGFGVELASMLMMGLPERAGATQTTEVMTVEADVTDVAEDEQRYVVSVRFTGTLREDSAQTTSFDEVWHLTKPRQGNGGWVLAGIQQVQ